MKNIVQKQDEIPDFVRIISSGWMNSCLLPLLCPIVINGWSPYSQWYKWLKQKLGLVSHFLMRPFNLVGTLPKAGFFCAFLKKTQGEKTQGFSDPKLNVLVVSYNLSRKNSSFVTKTQDICLRIEKIWSKNSL